MDRPIVTEDMILRILNSKEASVWDLIPDFSSFNSVNNALFTSYALGSPRAIKMCDDGKQTLHEVLAQMISHSLADTLEVLELYKMVCDVDVFKDVTGCSLDTTAWLSYKVRYPAVYDFLFRKYEECLRIRGFETEDVLFDMLYEFSRQDSRIREELIAEVDRVNANDESQRSQIDYLPVQVEDRAEEEDDVQEEE